MLSVIEDPEGALRPRTPGQVDATGELFGAGAPALAALGAVGWMTWRGSDAARRRDEEAAGRLSRVYQRATGNATHAGGAGGEAARGPAYPACRPARLHQGAARGVPRRPAAAGRTDRLGDGPARGGTG
ncbi:hypothetical protein LV779_19580 [Streptomyces thinghirensis]|nr:hypothetical protein [Streptomyces thinghirensis]